MHQASPTPARHAKRRRSPAHAGVLLAVGALACAPPAARPKADLLLQGSLYLDPVTLEPYSGPVFITHNGHIDARELYREGKRDGPYEWYFESGRLYERGTYVNGVLDGPYEAHYESGGLYERGTYRAGAFHGPRAWYLDGRLVELVTYAAGRLEGPYERYTQSGRIDSKGTLHDGQPCGRWLEGAGTIPYPPCATS